MTPTSNDDSHRTATASSGPVGRPEDAEVPEGDDTIEDLLSGERPSGHVLDAEPAGSDE
jgi:hypothetical protein